MYHKSDVYFQTTPKIVMVVKSAILVQIGGKRGRSDVIVSYIVKNNLGYK